ncbi:MAG: AsmA family protein [Tepidisphaeraceae bacterium]
MRRFVLATVGILILLVGVLAGITPYCLSTEAARGVILDRINANLQNAQLSIQDWNLSWTGGIEIKGIEIKDASDAHVLSVGDLSSGFSLLDLITGHINLGQTELKGVDFNLRRDREGNLNLVGLFESNLGHLEMPIKVRSLAGTVHFNSRTCTFEDDSSIRHVLVEFDSLDCRFEISNINQPIEARVVGLARRGGQVTSLNWSGSFAIGKSVAELQSGLDKLASVKVESNP